MSRRALLAIVTAAALGGTGNPSAQAFCPVSHETQATRVAACYSLVEDCVHAAVYYRVLTTSGSWSPQQVCPW